MATAIAQTAFAAIAFAGAGYLFKQLDKNGYDEEMKRHNLAMEELTRAKEKFYENQAKKRNEMMQLEKEMKEANADMLHTNRALELLAKIKKLMSIE